MEPTTVIKMPIVTEKVTAASEHNQYAFKVDNRATKTDVKQAIEAIYGVKVVDGIKSHGLLTKIGGATATF